MTNCLRLQNVPSVFSRQFDVLRRASERWIPVARLVVDVGGFDVVSGDLSLAERVALLSATDLVDGRLYYV